MIKVNNKTSIDESELTVSMVKSSGPGGQNVNKLNTKVVMTWNIPRTESLTNEEKERVMMRLANRIDGEGNLIVSAQDSRSAHRNRQVAESKLADLVRNALKQRKRRKPTGIPAGEKRKRVEEKRQKSRIKKLRQSPQTEE